MPGSDLVVWCGLALAGLVALPALVSFLVDPYQRFRTPRWYRPYYHRPRHLSAGLVRTQPYDLVLLGSSMLANLRPGPAGRILGDRCLKLSLLDPSAREIGLLLAAVLRAGKARRVVLALDPFLFQGATDRLGGDGRLPVALYRPGIAGHLAYLASLETLVASFRVVKRSLRERDPRRFDLELYCFDGDKRVFSREVVLDVFRRGAPGRVRDPREHAFEKLVANARTHLLPQLAAHPEVAFDLYLPPYSVLAWADNARKGVLDDVIAFRSFVVDATRGLPNVRVFDFQAAEELVTDLAEYCDLGHHSEPVSERILAAIAAGSGLATPASIRAADAALRSFAALGERTPLAASVAARQEAASGGVLRAARRSRA